MPRPERPGDTEHFEAGGTGVASRHTLAAIASRDAGGGIPAGCPVIDPLAQPAQFAPRGRIRVHLGFTVPAACTATSLQETARLSGAGGVVFAEQTATLGISPTGP